MSLLADAADLPGVEDLFVAEDREIFRLSLGDQHTIEWIFVLSRKQPGTLAMFEADRQFAKAQEIDPGRKIGSKRFSARELTNPNLSGNFPC